MLLALKRVLNSFQVEILSILNQKSKEKEFEFSYDPLKRFEIQLGVLNILVSKLFSNRTYRTDKIKVHPDFNPKLLASPHDLALLRLKERVELVPNEIIPICLPLSQDYPDSNQK